MGKFDTTFLWLVTTWLMAVHSSWLTDMETTCGSFVDDLFYKLDDQRDKCRGMRTAFRCIEAESDKQDWKYMIATQQVNNISRKISEICHEESVELCADYAILNRMKQCYSHSHLPQVVWNCSDMSLYIRQINESISCMRAQVIRCPDDDWIQSDLQGIDAWEQQAIECLTLLIFGTNADWLGDIKISCGSFVDDLFYEDVGEDPVRDKCRGMRTALKCMEENMIKADWDYMVKTHQIHNISVRIDKICNFESLQLCAKHSAQDRMQQCYVQAGLPQVSLLCGDMKSFLPKINKTISCMREQVMRCPDDDWIQSDVQGIDLWEQQAMKCSLLTSGATSSPQRNRHVISLLLTLMILLMVFESSLSNYAIS